MPEALSVLSEEEALFQASVRQFARERVAPHVRAMDESGVFRKDLLKDLFDLGLAGGRRKLDTSRHHAGLGGLVRQPHCLGLRARRALATLTPQFSDAGHGDVSSASIFQQFETAVGGAPSLPRQGQTQSWRCGSSTAI
mgnify:CR=1 FL=1